MNSIPTEQMQELEREILNLGEYDKIEISLSKGRVQIIRKSTRKVQFHV